MAAVPGWKFSNCPAERKAVAVGGKLYQNQMYIILAIILFAPVIFIYLYSIFKFSKETIQDVSKQVFKPQKGQYNSRIIDFKDYIVSNKIFNIYIEYRTVNQNRYIMLKHLTDGAYDIGTYKSTFLVIPESVDQQIKSQFSSKYPDGRIKDKQLYGILQFLTNHFEIHAFSDYKKEECNHFELTPKWSFAGTQSDSYIEEIFSSVKNYRDIYYSYNLTNRRMKTEALKLIKTNNWDYTKFQIPRNWQYDVGTKEYNSAVNGFHELD